MKYSAFGFAAVAAAGAVGAQSTSPKWVPLQHAHEDEVQPRPVQPPIPVSAAQAQADGYAQGQAALAGTTAPQSAPPTVAQAPVESGGVQQPLSLTCGGAGTADKQSGTFLVGRYGWASAVSHHDRQFEDQVDVRLFNGDDRIRLPRTMLPGIHGGHDGWFKLKDVVAGARSIDAHASVSAFHNPKVHIDRVTGTISISGKDGDYSGQCEAMQADAPARF